MFPPFLFYGLHCLIWVASLMDCFRFSGMGFALFFDHAGKLIAYISEAFHSFSRRFLMWPVICLWGR